MKINVGDVVELNNGQLHEVEGMIGDDPSHMDDNLYGPFVIKQLKYHQNGRFGSWGVAHPWSVKRILRRSVSNASDDTQSSQKSEPKLWRDMTDEERRNIPADVFNDLTNPLQIPWGEWSRAAKGAVLLSDHEGEMVEAIDSEDPKDTWEWHPEFNDEYAYRIKPEHVRETVTLMIDDGSMGGPRVIGTIDLEDGKLALKWECKTLGEAAWKTVRG